MLIQENITMVVVRIYNNKVEMFPSNIFAGLFGYKSKAMFEASANEREKCKR